MVRLGAPITAFTSEEVWEYMDESWKEGLESVHLTNWPQVQANWKNEELAASFNLLIKTVRPVVMKKLEEAREAGTVKHSYDASVTIAVNSKKLKNVLTQYEELLPALFVVSTVEQLPAPPQDGEELKAEQVQVITSQEKRCDRCWRRPGDVGDEGLCARCGEALA